MMTLLTTTGGAARMLSQDPHGWTLTLISIMVVFGCLLLLFCFYSLSGAILSGKFRRKAKPVKGKTADSETEAAIALALHLYLCGETHDKESGIITIRPRQQSGWTDKSLTLRKINR